MIGLVAAGWGEGWWRVGGAWFVSDGDRLWAPGPPTRWWPVRGVLQVVRDDGGLRAVTAAGEVALGDEGHVRPLPRGHRARWGDLEVWVADGFVYARRGGETRAVDAVGGRERAWVGGGGVVVVEGAAGLRIGAPGRTPRAIGPGACVRVADDGAAVALRGPDGAVRLALPGLARTPLAGWPVTDAASWGDGALHGHPGPSPIAREGTAARHGPLLAGPDARVWDLGAGRPVTAPGTVCAGITVAVAAGFVTIDAETGVGGFVDAAGPGWRVALPLDPDDVVRDARADGDAVWVGTALGEGFRLGPDGAVRPAPPPPRARRPRVVLDSAAGPLPTTGSAEVGGATWAWNDDGWLWRLGA